MSEIRWTAEQTTAITAEADSLLVASAGAGKTTTIVGKILWLLGFEVGRRLDTGEPIPRCPNPCGIEEIAAITFTEKAAYDLKRKLRTAIEGDPSARHLRWDLDRAAIGTIHGFCGDLLRENALRLAVDPTFRVLDEREAQVEQDELIRQVIFEALEAADPGAEDLVRAYKLHGYQYTKGAVDYVRIAMRDLRWYPDRHAGWFGDDGLDLERLRELAGGDWTLGSDEAAAMRAGAVFTLARTALERWRHFQRSENARDFDAIILDARALLTDPDNASTLAGIRDRFRILIIDEFQDTDAAQRDIAFAIAHGEPGPQLLLVGDPKQSIYRFRGAHISVWNQVAETLSNGSEPIELSHNFRSAPPIIEAVNAVCERAMDEVGREVEREFPTSRVHFSPLLPSRDDEATSAVEWLVSDGDDTYDKRQMEGEHVARRIRQLVEHGRVRDPVSREERPCRYRDIAVLYRTRTGIEQYEEALRRHGIPYYQAAGSGFSDRQEVLDLLTVLRLIENHRDDMKALAYLRSPFVGLRDEVIARLRADGKGDSLLRQARDYLENGKWFDAPEDARIVEIEKESLDRGLNALRAAVTLSSRVPLDELLDEVLERTGYRMHLLLLERKEEALANVQRFLRMLEAYRHLPLGTFLEIWDHWFFQDNGMPQAPLFSKEDDVVTMSTIHRAKGLEWPVVILVDLGAKFSYPWFLANSLWTDEELGPILCPKKNERGLRAERLYQRAALQEKAEEARLLYVAATRAGDKLILAMPRGSYQSYGEWFETGLPAEGVEVAEELPPVTEEDVPGEVSLEWMDHIEAAEAETLVEPIGEPPLRFVTSATELMTRARNERDWRLKYRHGIIPPGRFVPSDAGDVPAVVRGTLIHGVLERIEEEEELAALLDETIGALDAPELEVAMAPGSRYRAALEEEIRRVLQGEEWRWYVEGEHYRELAFVHLAGARSWRVGKFDLYRPDEPEARIIDFKTHQIGPEEVEEKAQDYAVQSEVYTAAAEVRGPARMELHFTHPNVVIELTKT